MTTQTSTPGSSTGSCRICGGPNDESHKGRQHVYTEQDGDLRSPDKKQPQQTNPMVVRLPGAQTNEVQALNRLMEVLLEKNALTHEEALYVVGVTPKPSIKSGFADPASFPEGITR